MQRRGRLPWMLVALAALVVLASGCSTARPWLNAPLQAVDPPEFAAIATERDPSILVAVALSGGGARAAAFGFGVLAEMHRTHFRWNGADKDLLDATDVISGVSGGSILAAYYAAFGAERLPDFERDFLRQNFQNSLVRQTLRPLHLFELTSPWFGRSQLLARRLDLLYEGKTFADIERDPRHPQLVIAATDMSLGTSFEFTDQQFELICSDLRSVPLSFAVAASSAVPMALSPVTLKNYSDDCPSRAVRSPVVVGSGADYRIRMYQAQESSYLDAQRRPYVHLVDGGVADNLGVRRLLDRALAGGSLRRSFSQVGIPAGSVRKMVLITVNAERDPATQIDTSDRVPGLMEVADTLLFGAGARATTETQEFLTDVTTQWRAELRARSGGDVDVFAPDAEIHVIQVNLKDARENLQRRALLQVPTSFTISGQEVTGLIEAGGSLLRQSAAFQVLMRSLGAGSLP